MRSRLSSVVAVTERRKAVCVCVREVFLNPIEKIVVFERLHGRFFPVYRIISDLRRPFQSGRNFIGIELICIDRGVYMKTRLRYTIDPFTNGLFACV